MPNFLKQSTKKTVKSQGRLFGVTMKILLKIMLPIILLTTSLLFASEIDSINLITPISYNKVSSSTQNFKSKFLAGAASTFNIDIEEKVISKISPYRQDLQGYFANQRELDNFIQNTIQKGIRENLKEVTDANLISFYQYLGNNLIATIASKILDKEGVKDPVRKSLWIKKLLIPFNICILNSSNSQYDADHCIAALTSSLVPSLGVGLVYELSRSNLSSALPEKDRSSFNTDQVNLYTDCINKTKNSSTDVKECALSTMKAGVLKITDTSLTKIISEKSSSGQKSIEIKNLVWPAFNSCAQQVGSNPNLKTPYSDQFKNCIDDLIQLTGAQLVFDKISNTPSIATVLSKDEVTKLALEKSAQFKICAEAQKRRGAKKDGLLDIAPCENAITNEVTYKVVLQTFQNTALDSLKGDSALAAQVGNNGIKNLNRCWNNNQTPTAREACLKKSIITFSENIANLKLNKAIPIGMNTRGSLIKNSVASLTQCIERELPKNISESNNLNTKIERCSGQLTKNVAIAVADYQIRETAGKNLTPEATNALVASLVLDDFSKCIGPLPSDIKLEECGNILTTKAAKEISEISFTKEVNDYLKKSGGLQALGVTQEQVDSFIMLLNKSNQECIDQKTSGEAIDQVNICIKKSIHKVAFFFGDIQFNKNIGNMYDGRSSDKQKVEEAFRKSLGECLSTKESKEFSIEDYTKNLYVCSDKVSGEMSLIIGEDQINTSINQYLRDRPEMDLQEKRDSIKTKLLGEFKSCMQGEAKQSSCIDGLKKSATQLIVINYGRIETKVQINADKAPTNLKLVEEAFTNCTNSQLEGDALAAHLEDCTKNFALDFARELGTLKLNYLMKQALGTEGFEIQKQKITSSLKLYNDCLDSLKSTQLNDGLTDKLKICTDGLTNRGMNLVRSSINKWMTTEEKDAATLMIKQEFSNLLPCLSALLPASPYTQELQQNIDSSVKPLAILLAHYIEYNPENAKQTLDGIIQKLSVDLNDVAATKKAKIELLDFLLASGALDQFIKAIVRGTVKDSLAEIPENEIPPELREILLRKDNFEEIFNSEEGLKIKNMVMNNLLRPALVEGADMKGEVFQNSTAQIKGDVIKLLINSPSFGEQAIKVSIQHKINDMSGVTRFFAKIFYGGDALNWEKVRLTPAGVRAEMYIKEVVLTPKFSGKIQSPAEIKKAMEEAEKLVTNAVKTYGK